MLASTCADHSFRPADFCSSRFRRRGVALSSFALPRRHCSAARPALGRHHKCVGDRYLGVIFSRLHLFDLVLVRTDLAICYGWYGRGRPSRIAWSNIDPLGKPISRTLLHSKPVARPSSHRRNRGPSDLRLVACRPRRQCHCPALADKRNRNSTLYHRRSRFDRLLSGLRHWGSHPNHPLRTIAETGLTFAMANPRRLTGIHPELFPGRAWCLDALATCPERRDKLSCRVPL